MDGSRSFEGRDHGQFTPRQQLKPKPAFVKTSGTRLFGDPQVRVAAAEEWVTNLESALEALHGVEGPLKQAREVKKGLPLDVQITLCEGFLSRARAHLTELGAKRAVVSANIQEAAQRLEAVKVRQQQFVAALRWTQSRSFVSCGRPWRS